MLRARLASTRTTLPGDEAAPSLVLVRLVFRGRGVEAVGADGRGRRGGGGTTGGGETSPPLALEALQGRRLVVVQGQRLAPVPQHDVTLYRHCRRTPISPLLLFHTAVKRTGSRYNRDYHRTTAKPRVSTSYVLIRSMYVDW